MCYTKYISKSVLLVRYMSVKFENIYWLDNILKYLVPDRLHYQAYTI